MLSTPQTPGQAPGPNQPDPPKRKAGRWLVAIGLVALGALGLYTAQAFAQRAYEPWQGAPRWQGEGWRQGMGPGPWMGEPGRGFEGRRGARFAALCSSDTQRWQPVVRLYLKTDLRLDASQSAAFDRLADSVLPGLEGVKAEACNNFAGRAGAAPDRLQNLGSVLRKAAAAADEALAPMQSFYASLNEAQKARVDQLIERGGRRWR
jgi:LTXXQ motif family protein